MTITDANKLLDILKRQISVHEELRGVMLNQQQCLRRFDSAGLDSLRQRGDLLADRIAELDERRLALTGSGARVSQMAGELPEPLQSQLLALSLSLRQASEDVASINRINQAAVQNMLSHFHEMYRMLAGANQAAVYGASGQAASGGVNSAFLVDAVA